MNIVDLPQVNLKSVPESLRNLADSIDKGEVVPLVHAIVAARSDKGELLVFGYGNVGELDGEVGLLSAAAMMLAQSTFSGD